MNPTEQDAPGRDGTGPGAEQTDAPKSRSQNFIAAASLALAIGELDAQSFGDRGNYGTHARGGLIAARRRSIRFLVRAAELASDIWPGMDHRHIETALRSLRLYPGDLLVNPVTGQWLSTKEAVAHRGRELAEAIAELALIVEELELELEGERESV